MLFGKRLKDLRKNNNMTQKQLGDLINVTKVSVCCYEKGTRTPTIETLLDLAKVFNVSIDYLLGNDVSITIGSDSDKRISMAKEEIDIIKELRKHINLYDRIIDDPKRIIEFIDQQIRYKK